MAATQAENQSNEVNNESDLNTLQNGTDKNGERGPESVKSNHPEMSQYRPEATSLPNSEPHTNSVDSAGKIHEGKPPYDPGPGSEGGQYYGRGGYHMPPSDQHNPPPNCNDNSVNTMPPYGQYPQSMRHPYPAAGKNMPMVPPRPPSSGPVPGNNYGPGGQRFLSQTQQPGPTPTLNQLLQSNQPQHYQNNYEYPVKDQSYQQWGPQRPNYGPPQQPGPGPYRNQLPSGTAAPRQGQQPPQQQQQQPYYGTTGGNSIPPTSTYAQPGGPQQTTGPQQQQPQQQQQQQQQQPPPSGQQYPPYPGRYPTPPGAAGRQPFSPHQMPGPYGAGQPPGPNNQPPPSSYSEHQRLGWPPNQQQQQQQQQQPPGPPHPASPSPHPPQSPGHPPTSDQHPPPKPSPGPHQSPGHQPSSPPPPPSPHQQQNYPTRPQQSSTPNAHAPEQGELTGANSNDSLSGHAGPGTPNSGMRPTPSPTGSTSSRSMSPAVGQQSIPMPPRPSSGQSPHAPPGPYPQAPHGYKAPVYSQTGQPYPQGNYSPRPMQYGPGQYPPQQQPNNTGQYANRPMANHAQYPGYQGWGGPQGTPPPMMTGAPPNGGKGSAPQQAPSPNASSVPSSGPRPHTPPHYLKQHLQHKMGYTGPGPGMPPSPGPPQTYPSGPPGPMHHAMGPPPQHHPGMGPPQTMGPPIPPNSHMVGEGGMPPPASTPNSHPHEEQVHDNGITTTAGAPGGTHVTPSGAGGVTSIITTGPDGAPLDEASQQSTLSNTSAASGEDTICTPGKSRKEYSHSHPTTPQSTAPSPGAASVNSMHEDYDVNSSPTSWPRTPNSPKPDSLGKLYEMDESPERRHWLDRLLSFMEERGSPITACPTISKNPLDLFRLYLYVKERGGFMEVCKVAKNKTWKDIANLLGIQASSSAAYTLRKHYTKNLLAYECHFDRGGIDPQPIINQMEAQNKKKGSKGGSVPSPGSSNSQDSFPPVGSGGSTPGGMDGYSGYGYPPGSTPEYTGGNQRPVQTNAPSPHPGMQQPGGYPAQPGYPSPQPGYPDQYGRTQEYNQQYPPGPGGYPPRPGPVYPQYPQTPENDNRNYPQGNAPTPPVAGGPPPSNTPPTGPQDPYVRNYQPNYPGVRPGYSTPPTVSGPPQTAVPGQPPPSSYPPPNQQGPPQQAPPTGGVPPPPPQEYYRQDQMVQAGSYHGSQASSYPPSSYPNSQLARQLVAPQNAKSPYQSYGPNPPNSGVGGPPNKNMPPPAPQPPRRHPDFSKDQPPYQPYPQQRPAGYGNWPNNQYRGQYPQQWSASGPRPQWEPRYPPPSPPQQPNQQWGNSMSVPGVGQSSPLRSAVPRVPYRPDQKPYPGPQPMGVKPMPQQSGLPKHSMLFPPDTVEAVLPILYKRRRLTKMDVAPIEAWRIVMALRSGLVAEVTWALDVLNILLFDDSVVTYFGLANLPGLLDLILEHWRKSLDDVFDPGKEEEKIETLDIGEVSSPPKIDAPPQQVIQPGSKDFNTVSRKDKPVVVVQRCDYFVLDHRRCWDVEREEDAASTEFGLAKYMVAPFKGELLTLPFARRLLEEKRQKTEVNSELKQDNIKCEVKAEKIDIVDEININSETKVDATVKCEPNVDGTIKSEPNVDGTIKSEPNLDGAVKSEINVDGTIKSEIIIRGGVKRCRSVDDCEDECYSRDDSSLLLAGETQDSLARRCICISTIVRNLSFVPGNEPELARNSILLTLLGRLLLLHHEHPPRQAQQRNYDREEDADFGDSCSSLQGENEWWWDYLHHIREHVLVICANIAGHLDLVSHPEEISRPILDGLLHWAICPAAAGQDAFPTVGPTSCLSPQRLALEALCKLCVTETNVDLVIATPPYARLERLCAVLCKMLCRGEDQVLREFAVNLLFYLSAAESCVARTIAMQTPCVSLLLSFIEQAEQSAMGVANQHGINALRDNPDSMGTSLDMLRRAAATLLHLSHHPDNRPLFVQQEQRLLQLVMSQILDQQVASVISRVLFQCARVTSS